MAPPTKKPKRKLPIQQDSPLLDLPPEIRNIIYERVFENAIIKIEGEGLISEAPSLLLTCRQVYDEALGMYYACSMVYTKYGWKLWMWLWRTRLKLSTEALVNRRNSVKNALFEHAKNYWGQSELRLELRMIRANREAEARPAAVELEDIRSRAPHAPNHLLKASILAPSQEMVWTSNPVQTSRALEEEWAVEWR